MPDESPEPHQASMPPDPFQAADALYATVATEFNGLRNAGLGLVETALLVAAHLSLNGFITNAAQPPDAPTQAS